MIYPVDSVIHLFNSWDQVVNSNWNLGCFSQFYKELIQKWSEFREIFAEEQGFCCKIWNQQKIRRTIHQYFYKKYFIFGIQCVNKLLFNLDNVQSFNRAARNICGLVCVTQYPLA